MDSVILHEMAHLKHHHHRNTFWNFLTELLGEDARAQNTKMDIDMSPKYLRLDFLTQK